MMMATFDVKAHYERAVRANLRLWRERLLADTAQVEAASPDRWEVQKGAIWQAVADGLTFAAAQEEAARLAADTAVIIERWGIWTEWLPLLETAVALNLPPDVTVCLLLVQGRSYFLNRNFTDAIRVQEAALALTQSHRLTALTAQAHFHLTNTYLGSKAYSQARQHGADALRLLLPKPTSTLASLFTALGLIELETGDYAASEAQFQQSLALWSGLNQPTQMARTCLNLGVVYHRQNRLERARACYALAYAELAPTASEVDKLKVLNSLGLLHYALKELPQAETVFRQGVAAAQEMSGLFHLRGSLTHNLGNTLLAMARWEESRFYLEKSIRLWQQANDEIEQANSLGTLGEWYELQAEWATAVAYYDQALELLDAYPEHHWAQHLARSFRDARARCAARFTTQANGR